MTMALTSSSALGQMGISFPISVFVVSCLVYVLGRAVLASSLFQKFFSFDEHKHKGVPPASGLDQAEKGSLKKQEDMSDDELFQLEKRAFFSKTWLFICHRSRFDKPGDYHVFDFAEIAFFIVLGKDMKLRAFHNVCRHRAYTVVRKSCGTSSRFSCKYHGWQYDDQGRLVKAPKFDESPGFVPEENGLFEIKLITTVEGLVFVNFDASTMDLPFNNVKSHVDLGTCTWVDGLDVTCATNWKDIANEFSSQTQWLQSPFGWFSQFRRSKMARLLGPVSMIKELSDDLWCTMVLLPRSSSEVIVRCDIYAKEGYQAPSGTAEKWKWMLEKEVLSFSKPAETTKSSVPSYFSYQCGGRTIDLLAILAQHQRNEKMAKKKLQPAIRVTGTADIDTEAEALCDAIDGAVDAPPLETCARISSIPQTLEW